jgi:hypothetical protein
MKAMSPSAIDFEIRTMDMMDDFETLKQFLTALCECMKRNRDFEMLQSLVNVTLKIHSDIFSANASSFAAILSDLLDVQQRRWSDLDQLFQKSICLVDFIRN